MCNAQVSGFAVSERGVFHAEHSFLNLNGFWLQKVTDNLARSMHMAFSHNGHPLLFLAARGGKALQPCNPAGSSVPTMQFALVWRRIIFNARLVPNSWGGMAMPPDCLTRM